MRLARYAVGCPFFFDLRDQYYWDLVPGYRNVFVRRERGAEPLNWVPPTESIEVVQLPAAASAKRKPGRRGMIGKGNK